MKLKPKQVLLFEYGQKHKAKRYALKTDIIVEIMGEALGFSHAQSKRLLEQGGIRFNIYELNER